MKQNYFVIGMPKNLYLKKKLKNLKKNKKTNKIFIIKN
jgi:hypothetical protein